jgi:hypothetical protein
MIYVMFHFFCYTDNQTIMNLSFLFRVYVFTLFEKNDGKKKQQIPGSS